MKQVIARCAGASLATLLLFGCASSSTLPLADNVVKISARTSPICGSQSTERIALQQAAAETIKRGYDKFVIMQARYNENREVIGYTPVVASTTGSYGYGNYSANTYVTGDQPIVGGSNNSGLIVKMFEADDPDAEKALPAREILGPDWKEKVKSETFTCLE
jgi:hypothetical protein